MRTLVVNHRSWGSAIRIAESEPRFSEHIEHIVRSLGGSAAEAMALLSSGHEYRSGDWTYKLEAPSEDQADEPHVVSR
jgi:hypothetical protein